MDTASKARFLYSAFAIGHSFWLWSWKKQNIYQKPQLSFEIFTHLSSGTIKKRTANPMAWDPGHIFSKDLWGGFVPECLGFFLPEERCTWARFSSRRTMQNRRLEKFLSLKIASVFHYKPSFSSAKKSPTGTIPAADCHSNRMQSLLPVSLLR